MVESEQQGSNTSDTSMKPEGGPRQMMPGPVFGPDFYVTVLPDRVKSQCQGQPDNVPVVDLHLANGRILDLCHIMHLAETWFAVQYFRDTKTCVDMDVAFLPYDLVVLVTVSVQPSQERRIGFNVAGVASSISGVPPESARPA